MFYRGGGVEMNKPEAMRYYKLGGDQGYLKSINEPEALHFYKYASDLKKLCNA